MHKEFSEIINELIRDYAGGSVNGFAKLFAGMPGGPAAATLRKYQDGTQPGLQVLRNLCEVTGKNLSTLLDPPEHQHMSMCFGSRRMVDLERLFGKANQINILTLRLTSLLEESELQKEEQESDDHYYTRAIRNYLNQPIGDTPKKRHHLPSILGTPFAGIEKAVRQNDARVKILVMHPESDYSGMRADELGVPRQEYRRKITNALHLIESKAATLGSQIEIRKYHKAPLQVSYHIGRYIFYSILTSGQPGRASLTFKVDKDWPGVSVALIRHFKELWKNSVEN